LLSTGSTATLQRVDTLSIPGPVLSEKASLPT
jgi:hypothetical protein